MGNLGIKVGTGAMALWFGFGLWAAAPVITNIVMVPRLTIHSEVGRTNQIEYATDLVHSNWTVLSNITVTASPYWFVDISAPPAPTRYYRVLELGNSTPTNMALVPAGSFTMGNSFTNEGGSNELPVHSVNVSPFYMDRHEVSKAFWDEVYGWAITNGYSFEFGALGKAANHPAYSMTWYDAVKWCNARSEKEGRVPAYYTSEAQTTVYRAGEMDVQNDWAKWNAGYRLPTEAEWEKAARGGSSGQRFPWGDTITHGHANYFSTNAYAYDLSSTRRYHPTFLTGNLPYMSPVGYFGANGFGLYDMAGNVFEWCWDWYSVSYYNSSPGSDPRGPASGSNRVVRGGGWSAFPSASRTAYRNNAGTPDFRYIYMGFRSVLPAGQ